MSKKTIVTVAAVAALIFGSAAPALAQQQGQGNSNPGFFGIVSQFFSRMFRGNDQNQQGAPVYQLSGTPSVSPTGEQQVPEENRLQGLVKAGKITQAQEQEILSEVNKIKQEISSWSTSTGINSGYIYAGLRGPGMDAGIGNGQGQMQTTPTGVQVQNGMPLRGQQGPNGQNLRGNGR